MKYSGWKNHRNCWLFWIHPWEIVLCWTKQVSRCAGQVRVWYITLTSSPQHHQIYIFTAESARGMCPLTQTNYPDLGKCGKPLKVPLYCWCTALFALLTFPQSAGLRLRSRKRTYCCPSFLVDGPLYIYLCSAPFVLLLFLFEFALEKMKVLNGYWEFQKVANDRLTDRTFFCYFFLFLSRFLANIEVNVFAKILRCLSKSLGHYYVAFLSNYHVSRTKRTPSSKVEYRQTLSLSCKIQIVSEKHSLCNHFNITVTLLDIESILVGIKYPFQLTIKCSCARKLKQVVKLSIVRHCLCLAKSNWWPPANICNHLKITTERKITSVKFIWKNSKIISLVRAPHKSKPRIQPKRETESSVSEGCNFVVDGVTASRCYISLVLLEDSSSSSRAVLEVVATTRDA